MRDVRSHLSTGRELLLVFGRDFQYTAENLFRQSSEDDHFEFNLGWEAAVDAIQLRIDDMQQDLDIAKQKQRMVIDRLKSSKTLQEYEKVQSGGKLL